MQLSLQHYRCTLLFLSAAAHLPIHSPQRVTRRLVGLLSDRYVPNQSAAADDVGHKWSLHALRRTLKAMGIDDEVWSRQLNCQRCRASRVGAAQSIL